MNIIEMYDYRTACRNRAFHYGALVGTMGTMGNGALVGDGSALDTTLRL
jgi:hypothetical protein